MLPFLIAVFVVAIAGTFLALQIFGGSPGEDTGTTIVTVPVIITATPDPLVSPQVIIITATTDRTQVAVPADIVTQAGATSVAARPTVAITGAVELNAEAAATQSALPQNCIVHTIVEGDTPFGIAVQYSVNPFIMLEANGLTEETSRGLQIGDTLVVPLEGCAVETLPGFAALPTATVEGATPPPTATAAAQEATEEATLAQTLTPAPSPTITLAPTAASAQVTIVGVDRPGDITAEGIRIRNNGNTVAATGWRLSDADGNEYTFGELLIFSNTEVTIYTRSGQNTPIALFWGLDRAVWAPGDVVTLRDARGQVQATIRLEGAQGLP
jgi:LysM repeat protein